MFTHLIMERVARIELANKPWQGFRLPLHHTRIVFGAPEETRTPKIWLLRPTRIPIPSPGRKLTYLIVWSTESDSN